MNGRVAVLCPSRDNPDGVCRLAHNIAATTNHTDLLVYADEDQFIDYRDRCTEEDWKARSRITLVKGPRIGPVPAANDLVRAYPEYDLYGLIPDDATVKTPGWDDWCLSALRMFPNRVGVISPAHSLGRHVDMPFVSNRWINATGWFACPEMYHYAWPLLTGVIGEMTAILHAPESAFLVEHDGHLPANQSRRSQDAEVFLVFVANELPAVVERLRMSMEPRGELYEQNGIHVSR